MPNYCRRCGCKNIPDETDRCPDCGAPIQKKVSGNSAKKNQFVPKNNPYVIPPPGTEKSKTPWIITLAFVLVLSLGAGFYLGNKNENKSVAAENTTSAITEETVTAIPGQLKPNRKPKPSRNQPEQH